jgi:PP-loop superfamily ATP-utilizing enzyme
MSGGYERDEARGAGEDPAARDTREVAAERLLAEHGLAGVRVRTAGHEREVAAIAAPPSALARLAELAPAIRALGFRYVALELE